MPDHDREMPDDAAVTAAVKLLAAIAHPARLLVLEALHRRGPMAVGELQQLVALEQSATSHQLKVLRDARLVRSERRGRQVIYELADHHVAHIVGDALAHVVETRDG